MRITAIIFDLDGTVVLSEEAYEEAFRRVLKEEGVKDIPKHPQVSGIGVKENWEYLKQKHSLSPSVEALTRRCQDEYLSHLERVRVREGFSATVQQARKRGIKVALATSNAGWLTQKVIGHFGLDKDFASVTSGDEVERAKPAPDLFLRAAQKLGVEPKECVVIEDSPAGVEAAKNAEMRVVALTSSYATAKDLREADVVVSKLEEVSWEQLEKN